MGLEDWQEASAPSRRGGQGEVHQVRHVANSREAALNRLHAEGAAQKERRCRFLAEMSGLRAMNGDGVPAGAFSAKRTNKAMADFGRRMVDAGKALKVILVAVARKLMVDAYAVIRI